MAKYAMLNCWSDLNRGDLGIMLASIEEIRRQDSSAEIIGISSFDANDKMFENCHRILRRYVPMIKPSLCGILGLRVGNTFYKGVLAKLIAFFFETVRFGLIKIVPCSLAKKMLFRNELKTLEALLSVDICFSKGGSVFTDYGSIRGKFALYRTCHLFEIMHKFQIPYYILGQSFGPVTNAIGVRRVNHIIERAEKVFIREKTCIEKYPQLNLKNKNVLFSNDTAFLLKAQKMNNCRVDEAYYNIGMTVRPLNNDVNGYITVMTEVIEKLLKDKKVFVHIFQQVSMSDEPDNVTAQSIIAKLPNDVKKRVIYHMEELIPQELCYLYSKMKILIGTRLHSTIFSMTVNTPAIGLVYHGTKTQGIFANIGVPELVIEAPLTADKIIDTVRYVKTNYCDIKETIFKGVNQAQKEMKTAVNIIVTDAIQRNTLKKYYGDIVKEYIG